jgi:periplasmic protein TonB
MLATSAMKAHPLSFQRPTDSTNQAPVIDPATADSEEIPMIGSSTLAVPPPAPEGPIRVGGRVKQPKLISAAMPVYPPAAKAAHIQGDVVVDTRISKEGFVISMKAISGPTMLRQAALDALRKWKYQPSELDGQPVPVQMFITIQFRL